MDSVLQPTSLSHVAAFLTGATYGLGYCGPCCGPFLCTYIMGTQAGAAQGAKSLAVFTLARILTLGALGFGSTLLGTTILSETGHSTAVSFFIRTAIVATGLLMWLRPARGTNSSQREPNRVQIGQAPRTCRATGLRFLNPTTPLWVVGSLFALVPCPPLLVMLGCASQAASPWAGAQLLMLFGLGTAVSPLLLVGVLAGVFSQRIRSLAPQHTLLFQRTSAVLLILLGVASAM